MYFTIQIDENLSLALVEPNMTPELFALIDENRAYLREWLPWVDHTLQISDIFDSIKSSQQSWAAEKALSTTIWFNGKIVGIAGFTSLSRTAQNAEIGFWLAEKYQKQGIMTKAVKILISYGFNHLNLRKIVICSAAENKKSRNITEKLGLRLEGVLRQDTFTNGKWHDRCVYGVLKEEWENIN